MSIDRLTSEKRRPRSRPRARGAAPLSLGLLLLPLLASCGGNQSALNAAGPQSGRIQNLWWLLLAVSAVVWVLVVAALFSGLFRRPPAVESDNEIRVDRTREGNITRIVT